MEDKLDKILDNQQHLFITMAEVKTEIKNKKEILDKHEKEIEALKKFKWGIVGTTVLSGFAFFKDMLGI